jgi:hypothetical protein
MNEPLTKQTVLNRLRDERSHFEELLAGFNANQMTNTALNDGWTIKDTVAHLTAWEKELLRWLKMADEGQPPDMPRPGQWDSYIEAFNARQYAANRQRPLDEVMTEFRLVYSQLWTALQTLPDDPDDPSWSVWYGGQPPWGLVATYYHHYAEHGQAIESWLPETETGSMSAEQ